MDWGSPEFVIAIIALSTVGWVVNNWIRAKHGYDLEDEWGGKTAPKNDPKIAHETAELRAENAKLVSLLENQGARMETLERIVTDKGYRLNEEIEALRDLPTPAAAPAAAPTADSGVPLNMAKKETI
ncbi:hypothetical protein N8940_02305 [Sphingomonadaceae bacterium]|nr:hypothetical protein [Sphingomonadaceae bacterium]